MLDFILKLRRKLEYYENVSLAKLEVVLEIRLCAKDLTGSKALLPTTRTSDFDPRDRK